MQPFCRVPFFYGMSFFLFIFSSFFPVSPTVRSLFPYALLFYQSTDLDLMSNAQVGRPQPLGSTCSGHDDVSSTTYIRRILTCLRRSMTPPLVSVAGTLTKAALHLFPPRCRLGDNVLHVHVHTEHTCTPYMHHEQSHEIYVA